MLTINAQSLKQPFKIALVTSEFNKEITDKLYEGAIARLKELAFTDQHITSIWVPGAFEIPLIAQKLARAQQYEAIICLGAVIRGETSHYDYVCQQVSHGCQKVALKNDLPIIFGILTTENEEQALARAGGAHGNKGHDAVDAAIHMVSILRQLAT